MGNPITLETIHVECANCSTEVDVVVMTNLEADTQYVVERPEGWHLDLPLALCPAKECQHS